ncbi:N-acetylmuramoyl-L-alanine amidase family protein [Proteiniborus sp. MB09-C3]|uniref:N-acetylmuramoyl-L-alanine amidase family protein n=1 Tax=Proteiniborus sp. MB09-C3 TaxID=3050072 RepID=UPI00255545F9|nr:N-acetylmuramoyl-L-alanine amidase family protein [Proteiniborus sp. MB09-C3]WIV11887.1 N-acetylmuramoyl-L-alanine amidase family protein [Proteiniborus sp. MB09-C3]
MKKIVAVFMVLVMLMGIGAGAVAGSQNSTKISINGKQISVTIANVMFDGKPIETDIPPIILKDRTLVPIRSIGNHLNAEVDWNQQTKEATVKTINQEIILTLNSSIVSVNGVKKEIPYGVPAILVNDSRIMVPLRFVSEILGYTVDWDQKTRTGTITSPISEITGISVENTTEAKPKINIISTGKIEYSEEYSTEPDRLIIDVHNSKLNISDKSMLDSNGAINMDVNKSPIKSIRMAEFSSYPETVRIVIDLDEHIGYSISSSNDSKLTTISFLNNVRDISSEKVDGREAIVIKNSEEFKYNMFTLSNPSRVVIDILDSKLWTDSLQLDVNSNFIKRIRSSQYVPDPTSADQDNVVRVVLDINENKTTPNIMIDVKKTTMTIFVDDEAFRNISYSNKYEDGGLIKISAEEKTNYSVNYDENNRRMEIKVNKNDINLEKGIMEVNDENITNIAVDEDEKHKIITFSFKEKIEYEILSDSVDDTIQISFNKMEENNGSKLIIIDAGHGGKDPGAIAPNTKVKEKDLNLKVALKLDKKLKELGFRTILTRSTDEFIDLYERAGIANRNNADAFISIHFNSNTKSDIAGVQTLYCPAFDSKVKEGDQYPFAKAIQDSLLSGLNNKDKGIIKRPDLVVIRETKMVAALAELGFVTNPAEEKLIITDEYHEKAAQALANGIVNYFNSTEK